MAEKEYIERGALIAEMDSDAPENWTNSDTEIQEEWDYHRYRDIILAQPTADVVEVVHASWKDNHCTRCGWMPMGEELWDSCDFSPPRFEYFMDFCPSCGAKMDGERRQ